MPLSTSNKHVRGALDSLDNSEKERFSFIGRALPEPSQMSRTLHIALRGCGEGPKRQNTMMKELLAGAAHALVQRGFGSVSSGIQIVAGVSNRDKDRKATSDLLFPCVLSARGFFLLFDEYVWDSSDGCHSVVVGLSSDDELLHDRSVKRHFADPSMVTPDKIAEYFNMGALSSAATS